METIEVIDSRKMTDEACEEFFLHAPGEEKRIAYVLHDGLPKKFSLDIHLRAPETRAEVWLAIVAARGAATDISVRIFHEAQNTFCRINGKAALFGDSRLIFKGNLIVAEHASGADTYFLGKALMMSREARAEIFPHLEIKTSAVRASHGSSVGRVNAKDLFYLRARGLAESDAEKIFLNAFFCDIRTILPPPYQQILFTPYEVV